MAEPSPLEIGIVGGGIAGLSAAIALKRAGHNVEIFERNVFENAVGIAITVAPNAGKVYKNWGFDLKAAGAVEGLQIRHLDGITAEVSWQDSVRDSVERYGAGLVFLRHSDLHNGLCKHLEATEGHPVKINIETEITEVDCEAGILQMRDGSTVKKDLLVLANGLGCRFLSSVTGKDCPLIDTETAFIRYFTPAKDVYDDPESRPLFENQDDDICFFHNFAAGTSIITYLCDGGKTRVFNVSTRRPASKGARADRSARVNKADLIDITKAFHPSVRAIIRNAPEEGIFSYPLTVRDPLTTYVNGKTVLIGDAAHVMKPLQGQGGSIAIESTGCLEVLFKGIGKKEIPSRLKLFEQLRLPRCGPVHIFSNMPFGPDGYAWMKEKIQPFWDPSRPLPPPGSRPASKPFRDFIYNYNVREESEKALAAHLEAQKSQADTGLNVIGEDEIIQNGTTQIGNIPNGTSHVTVN